MANERELEEFLLRAAERRVAQNKRRPEKPPRTLPRQPAQRELVQEAELVNEGVAEHVERHLDSSAFDQRAERLGDDVEIADDLMEERLHEKFDHQVGLMDEARASGLDQQTSLPPALGFLTDKNQLIQAIIVSEILGRPSDRW